MSRNPVGHSNDSALQRPDRRKRSRLSRRDCLAVFESFARTVLRQAESSGALAFSDAPQGQIDVVFRVVGRFGAADDMFEAVRVLAGYKLPKKS